MKKIFRSAFMSLILWCAVPYADVRIQITQGVDIARPIGVVPFKSLLSSIPEDIGNIIASDLRNSGKFNLLDVSRQPQTPSTVSEITPLSWRTMGINTIIIGQVQSNADRHYIISYQLVDISCNQINILANNQYKVTRRWLRYAAHTASDEIFEKLTGIQGTFRTRIAYIIQNKREKYPYNLFIADYDGLNQICIYRSAYPLMSPAWSPDGRKLAYVSFFEGGHSALLIQELDNGTIHQITNFPRHNGAPAFSPDGKKIAFALSKTGSLNVYVMDFSSRQIRCVTNSRNNNTEPTWFPDSQTLAYTSDQSGRPQVYKINIHDGGEPQRLSWNSPQNQNASVSSDGKFLIMVSRKDTEQHIAKLDLVTGSVQILTDTFMDETPSIAPNGTMIIYSCSQGLNSVLQLISTNGNYKICLLKTDGQIKFPAWSPCL